MILGVHCEIAADEETVEASAEYIYGDEDDEEEFDGMNELKFQKYIMNLIGNKNRYIIIFLKILYRF